VKHPVFARSLIKIDIWLGGMLVEWAARSEWAKVWCFTIPTIKGHT